MMRKRAKAAKARSARTFDFEGDPVQAHFPFAVVACLSWRMPTPTPDIGGTDDEILVISPAQGLGSSFEGVAARVAARW
jgi:hypothetical protein